MTNGGAYPEYKETGLKWLGQVPASWGVVPLWTLYSRGKCTDFPDEELLSVYRDHGVVPKSSRGDNFNKPSEDLSAYQLVKPGDMVINKMKAWQGSVAISRHRGIVSPAYFVYERHHGMDDRYLHYLLRSERYITGYLSLSKGIRINQWDLDPTYHSRMPVLVPSLQEQRAIVDLLDREIAQIDKLIGKQERLIELLAEKRRAIITHAVTKGPDPSAPTKPSGIPWLGDLPSHWTTSRLKWTCPSQESGTSVNGMDIPAGANEFGVLKTGAVSKGYFVPEANKTVVPEDVDRVTCPVRGGTLIVNRANTPDLVGSTGRTAGDAPSLFLSDKLWQIDFERADTNFIYWWSKTDVYRSQIQFRRVGASTSMQNLSSPDFLTVDIALPALEEQEIIAKYVDARTAAIDLLKNKAQKAIVLLRERRSALISAAVTGKIDVHEGAA